MKYVAISFDRRMVSFEAKAMSSTDDSHQGDVVGTAAAKKQYASSLGKTQTMTTAERRQKRQRHRQQLDSEDLQQMSTKSNIMQAPDQRTDDRFAALLARNEDELLRFVANVNKVYQELMCRPAPFMTFVFCGMQSAGKSTIMERFLKAVLNIVQEGTGTRCPLDTTCIHDSSCVEATCELGGEELPEQHRGSGLTMNQVFERITQHNKKLGEEDTFSTKPLYLRYRSSNVQNMRFVDTPGIISNRSTGKDNREDIKKILRSEMRKPNTKLCVLLEPKEFATNPIVDFCDETFGGRDKWIDDATFLMTKFDKQLEDARTGSKANAFFKEFHENKCFPHLVITKTLPKEDLPPAELFEARKELLAEADSHESEKFDKWLEQHDVFRSEMDDEILNKEVQKRIGFSVAKKVMREIMLKDTVERLPEVLDSLRADLNACDKEARLLKERQKFNDAKTLKGVVESMLFRIQERIQSYLDGDLQLAMKFPEKLQTLEEEIEEEEESDWAIKELNFHTDKEDHWRDRIANMEEFPEEISADAKFMGGKQYQRAIEFFRSVMIDALPDPYQLKDLVPHATGYLMGGLQRENWERAMVEITRVCLKDVSHPGMNYLIKHVGSIFRRMFIIALDDIKQGEEFSNKFKLMPSSVERHLTGEFEDMLWELMVNVGNEIHSSLEPMYSTIDPGLPTFHTRKFGVENDEDSMKDGLVQSFVQRMKSLASNSGEKAKEYLKEENRQRAIARKTFLPDERASMITKEETNMILQRSFEYIVALLEINLIVVKFQLNHHLYEGFKKAIRGSFIARVNRTDWETLIQRDESIDYRLAELDDQIKGLSDSLHDVQIMQRRL